MSSLTNAATMGYVPGGGSGATGSQNCCFYEVVRKKLPHIIKVRIPGDYVNVS